MHFWMQIHVMNESLLNQNDPSLFSRYPFRRPFFDVILKEKEKFARARNAGSFYSFHHAVNHVKYWWSAMLENILQNFVRWLVAQRTFWYKGKVIFFRRRLHLMASFHSKFSFLSTRMKSISFWYTFPQFSRYRIYFSWRLMWQGEKYKIFLYFYILSPARYSTSHIILFTSLQSDFETLKNVIMYFLMVDSGALFCNRYWQWYSSHQSLINQSLIEYQT